MEKPTGGGASVATEPAPLAFTRDLSVGYGGPAVIVDVTFNISPGDRIGLLGPNGGGKSTLLRALLGDLAPSGGVINIDASVAALPQTERSRLDYPVSALDVALMGTLSRLPWWRRPGRAERRQALDALATVGLGDLALRTFGELSGGQRQRVLIARALVQDARLLLLDEPFSGLDSNLRAHIRDETLHVVKDSGTTTLIVTHDPEEAMYMADRIVVMNEGRVEQIDIPDKLYTAPANAFVATFFSSINRLEGVVRAKMVATPFGLISAPDLGDGTPVEVLMRPEALRVTPLDGALPEGAASAHVLDARMLRRASFIHLCFGGFEGQHLHFHSRVPGRYMPKIGDHVAVTLERAQTFVFPLRQKSR